MNNKEFDHLIKSSLKNMSSKGQPNWNRMERHVEEWEMNEGLVSDDHFDTLIAEKLEEVKVEYDQSSWMKLEEKMKRRSSIRKRIIYYQLTGAAVILLLFALIFQLNPSKFKTFTNDKVVEDTQELFEMDTPVAGQDISQNEEADWAKVQITSGEEKATKEQQKGKQPHRSRENDRENSSHIASPLVVADHGSQRLPQEGNLVDIHFNVYFENIEVENNSSFQVTGFRQRDSWVLSEMGNMDLWPQNEREIFVEKLDRSAIYCTSDGIFLPVEMEVKDRAYIAMLKPKSSKKQNTLNLALYATPQYLFLTSPFDALMNEPGYSRNWGTAGVGLGLDYQIGHWALGTGVEYARYAYAPRKIEERLEGSEALIHLAIIRGDMLDVPLQLKYHWKENGKFSFFSSVGLSFRMVMATDYEIHRSEQGLTDLIQDLRTNPLYQNTLYSKKDYEPGLMEGGNASSQILTGVELACGLQYQLDDRFALFAEPTFRYDFSTGFGPNQDKIHQLSLRAGVKGVLN